MAKKSPPPNRREAVILFILLPGEKYGRDIRNAYEGRTDEVMPLGSLYTTLDRMEEKGFVKSRMGDSEGERGGNRRKYYKITASGMSSLNDSQRAIGMPMKGGLANA